MSLNSIPHWLRPHKTIPVMPWTGNGRWDLSVSRATILIFGLIIFGLGDSLLIQSHIGNAPWSVLAQGLSQHIHISLGWSTFILSSLVLLFWIPLGEKPGFGTLMNIIFIAAAIEFGVLFFPIPHNYFIGIIYCVVGIALVGMGSTFYITCGLGPGPRDGLMTALHNKTGVRVGRIRLAIEATVLVLGALLGGRIGLGTALFALFIGQSIAISLGVVSRITAR